MSPVVSSEDQVDIPEKIIISLGKSVKVAGNLLFKVKTNLSYSKYRLSMEAKLVLCDRHW